MKKLNIFLATWLVIAHVQLEVSPAIERIKPAYANEYINPFLDSGYKFPVIEGEPEGIQRKWWIKYCCNDIYRIMVFFVLTMVALRYSFLLGRIAALFFIYQVIDHALLWYNYRSTNWHYYLLNGVIIIGVILLFIPEKKRAKVISIE